MSLASYQRRNKTDKCERRCGSFRIADIGSERVTTNQIHTKQLVQYKVQHTGPLAFAMTKDYVSIPANSANLHFASWILH